MDVTDEASVRSCAAEAVDAFGGIDIFHANAGAVRFGGIDGQPNQDLAFTLRAELDSVWPTVQAAGHT
ncbi:SDR family oxidoreductase [Streptomyces sp. Inha503]|uniref:SDR family oxidoreductase n=1 Tax=Streptomyces sp. Inha503 TaxID=3383314 RepID=UPI0039A1EFD7